MASEAEALQCPSYKSSPLNKPRSRYIYKPKIQPMTNGLMERATWISTTIATNSHYGLKWAIDTTDATTGTTYGICRLYTKFYLAFKDPK